MEIEGMEFKAYHGCLEHERTAGSIFVVDFRAEMDLTAASKTDNLEDTLDYGAVYDIAANEMKQPSCLLEHVAGRIADAIETAFPNLPEFSVRVSKKNPPVNGQAAWSRITIRRSSGNGSGECSLLNK